MQRVHELSALIHPFLGEAGGSGITSPSYQTANRHADKRGAEHGVPRVKPQADMDVLAYAARVPGTPSEPVPRTEPRRNQPPPAVPSWVTAAVPTQAHGGFLGPAQPKLSPLVLNQFYVARKLTDVLSVDPQAHSAAGCGDGLWGRVEQTAAGSAHEPGPHTHLQRDEPCAWAVEAKPGCTGHAWPRPLLSTISLRHLRGTDRLKPTQKQERARHTRRKACAAFVVPIETPARSLSPDGEKDIGRCETPRGRGKGVNIPDP